MSDHSSDEMRPDLREYINRTGSHPNVALYNAVDTVLRVQRLLRRGQVTEQGAASLFNPDDPAAFNRLLQKVVAARRVLRAGGHPVDVLTLAWQIERNAGERQTAPSAVRGQSDGGDVPLGRVRVRLLPTMLAKPFAEFELSEADLASKVDPTAPLGHSRTVAYQAAEEVWRLSKLAARGDDKALAPEHGPQTAAYRATGQSDMTLGARVEVTRSGGARSMWRRDRVGWVLIDRRPSALAATASRRRAERAQHVRNSGAATPPIAVPHRTSSRETGFRP